MKTVVMLTLAGLIAAGVLIKQIKTPDQGDGATQTLVKMKLCEQYHCGIVELSTQLGLYNPKTKKSKVIYMTDSFIVAGLDSGDAFEEIHDNAAAGFTGDRVRPEGVVVLPFAFEVSETAEQVQHVIEIVHPKDFAHVVHEEVQTIVFELAIVRDAGFGKVEAAYIKSSFVQVDGMPAFSTGDVEYPGP